MENIEDYKTEIENLYDRDNVKHLSNEELYQLAKGCGTITEFGNLNFSSSVKNRSAGVTIYLGSSNVRQKKLNEQQMSLLEKAPATIEKVNKYIKNAPLVCVERNIGDNKDFSPYCRLYVSVHRKDNIRIPYMWSKTVFEPVKKGCGPAFNLIYVPEWQEKDRQVLVLPELGVTYVLGTDYFGEAKKGFLRLAMWYAKQNEMLGLHAGSKIIRAKDTKGDLKRYSMLLFGLSATGKTTHACHHHGLTSDSEGVEIVQDDIVFWRKDGAALGSERGFFIKTDGLEKESQPLLYNAATKKDAIFENVLVDYKGVVDFNNIVLAGNGRGIIQMSDLAPFASKSVNLSSMDELDGLILAFITRRNTILPIASKLTPEQAAIAFMLGESIETSAGNPKRAGESVRVVGTNPFIVGDEGEEGNIFYDIVKKHSQKIQCFLLNTGGVGEINEVGENGLKINKQKVTRVEITEMASIIRGIARDNIEWVKSPYFDTLVPDKVEGVDMTRFDLSNFYSKDQIESQVNKLKEERREYLKKFPCLDPKILEAIE